MESEDDFVVLRSKWEIRSASVTAAMTMVTIVSQLSQDLALERYNSSSSIDSGTQLIRCL